MNEESQEVLKSILAKDPSVLTGDEIAILKARRDYLTTEQKRIFKSVLGEQVEQEANNQPVEQAAETQPATPSVDDQVQVEVEVEQPAAANPSDTAASTPAETIEDDGSADPDFKPQN